MLLIAQLSYLLGAFKAQGFTYGIHTKLTWNGDNNVAFGTSHMHNSNNVRQRPFRFTAHTHRTDRRVCQQNLNGTNSLRRTSCVHSVLFTLHRLLRFLSFCPNNYLHNICQHSVAFSHNFPCLCHCFCFYFYLHRSFVVCPLHSDGNKIFPFGSIRRYNYRLLYAVFFIIFLRMIWICGSQIAYLFFFSD